MAGACRHSIEVAREMKEQGSNAVMSSDPLVSIITPTYNRADFLPVAIDSVLSQSMPDFELIVIDDGSEDGTGKLMERYLKDPRVRYLHQGNQGQSAARNRGIEQARGEYICFLDSDNAWVETRLATSLRAFKEHAGVDVVYGDYMVIDREGRELGVNRMRRYSGRITPHLLRDNFVSMNTTMTRRHCFDELGGFDQTDRLAEDYGLWLRFSTRYQFLYIPEVLGYYRVMDNQISSDKDRRFQANEIIIRNFLREFPGSVTRAEARLGLSAFHVRKGRYELAQGRRGRAFRELLRAIRETPLWAGPWRLGGKLVLGLLSGRPT